MLLAANLFPHLCWRKFGSEAAATIFWRDRNLLHLHRQPNPPWQGWRLRNGWCKKLDGRKHLLWFLGNWTLVHFECCTIWECCNPDGKWFIFLRGFTFETTPAGWCRLGWPELRMSCENMRTHVHRKLCKSWKLQSNQQFVGPIQINNGHLSFDLQVKFIMNFKQYSTSLIDFGPPCCKSGSILENGVFQFHTI